jgi:hypothetical protein
MASSLATEECFCSCCGIIEDAGDPRSNAWVCGRSLAGIAGSNPADAMVVCLVSVLCCQVEV